MRGNRIPDGEFPEQPGDYGRVHDDWIVCAPDGGRFALASVLRPDRAGKHHEVVEHEDGAMSVLPVLGNSNSLQSPCGWHGYINHGVWEEC